MSSETARRQIVARLRALTIGERTYFETTLDRYKQTMSSLNQGKSKMPADMREWEFSRSLLTAIGINPGDVRYLVCVERLH